MSLEGLELDESVYREVTRLCATGDQFAELGEYEEAVAEYNKAWELIPEPKNNWEASTWVLAAIADACFLLGKNESARQALEYAMTSPGGLGNPFLHLRFGQVLFESGELDVAADELMRAYMGSGQEIFENEDPKYLTFLKTRAKIGT
jgi:tetratricopeptide (TPR) repeat protein